MQYILTEEEKKELININEVKKRDKLLEWCFEQIKPPWCGKTYCDSCIIGGLKSNNPDCLDAKLGGNFEDLLCKKYKDYSK